MDQSLTYVKDQLSAGKTKDQIKMSLLGNGWQPAQIDALFAKIDGTTAPAPAAAAAPVQPATPVTPVQPAPQTVPISKPLVTSTEPVATPINKAVDLLTPIKPVGDNSAGITSPLPQTAKVEPVIPVKTDQNTAAQAGQTKKTPLWRVIVITVIAIGIGVGALLGVAAYLGKKNTSTTTTTTTVPTPTTSTYQFNGLGFTYPVAWTQTSINKLLNTGSTTTASTQALFFTSADLTTMQQQASQVDATSAAGVASYQAAANNLETLSVAFTSDAGACPLVDSNTTGVTTTSPTCTPPSSDTTAKSLVTSVLQTTYAGDGTATVNTAATVDQTKINTVTIAGTTCYWVTNGPTSRPYVALSVPVTSGAFQINFPSATNLSNLSTDLQAVYGSIKVSATP